MGRVWKGDSRVAIKMGRFLRVSQRGESFVDGRDGVPLEKVPGMFYLVCLTLFSRQPISNNLVRGHLTATGRLQETLELKNTPGKNVFDWKRLIVSGR